jgi:hypothetical protein
MSNDFEKLLGGLQEDAQSEFKTRCEFAQTYFELCTRYGIWISGMDTLEFDTPDQVEKRARQSLKVMGIDNDTLNNLRTWAEANAERRALLERAQESLTACMEALEQNFIVLGSQQVMASLNMITEYIDANTKSLPNENRSDQETPCEQRDPEADL